MNHCLKLAIVGRPNVGKSALFNRICGKKISIVDEAEGVTRDRLYAPCDFFGKPFILIDTGGIDAKRKALFNEEIKRQAEIAIVEADTIVMVVDGSVGMTPQDLEVAKILLRAKKPVCLAVNKADDLAKDQWVHQFYPLGICQMIAVSATQGRNIAELLEMAFAPLPEEWSNQLVDDDLKIAIVGRPNVGKSTLVNHLLNDERCIVSPIAGTTRDAIDAKLSVDGKEVTLIDTAGIRRKSKEPETADKFAHIRTERAIERADVCVLVLDAQVGMTAQDKQIAEMIEAAGKGCILLFNKWDLVKGFRMEHCLQGVHLEAPFLTHCPTLFGSAETGRNIEKLIGLAQLVKEESIVRIPTPELNKFIENTLQRCHPPMLQGKRLRIYYMVQVDVAPPKFVLFVNHASLMEGSYKRYLLNQFRDTFSFAGSPIIFHLRGKTSQAKPSPSLVESA